MGFLVNDCGKRKKGVGPGKKRVFEDEGKIFEVGAVVSFILIYHRFMGIVAYANISARDVMPGAEPGGKVVGNFRIPKP